MKGPVTTTPSSSGTCPGAIRGTGAAIMMATVESIPSLTVAAWLRWRTREASEDDGYVVVAKYSAGRAWDGSAEAFLAGEPVMNTKPNQRCTMLVLGGRAFLVTLVLMWLLCVSSLPPSVSAQGDELVQVRYTQTRLMKAEAAAPVVVEDGAYLIDPTTGRYRVERFAKGVHTVEIVDSKAGRRTVLDVDKKRAVVGSLSTADAGGLAAPGGDRTRSGKDSLLTTQASKRVDLGSKTIAGGVVVKGTRFTIVIVAHGTTETHTIDRWIYLPCPGSLPILLEERFEGPAEVLERRISDITRVPMAEEMFAIPRDFVVQDLRQNRGQK